MKYFKMLAMKLFTATEMSAPADHSGTTRNFLQRAVRPGYKFGNALCYLISVPLLNMRPIYALLDFHNGSVMDAEAIC